LKQYTRLHSYKWFVIT